MNKSEFMQAISDDTGIDLDVVTTILASGEGIIMDRMKHLEAVRPFKGINLEPKMKEGGEYMNPKTLDRILTKDKIVVKTTFSKVFNETLNGGA